MGDNRSASPMRVLILVLAVAAFASAEPYEESTGAKAPASAQDVEREKELFDFLALQENVTGQTPDQFFEENIQEEVLTSKGKLNVQVQGEKARPMLEQQAAHFLSRRRRTRKATYKVYVR